MATTSSQRNRGSRQVGRSAGQIAARVALGAGIAWISFAVTTDRVLGSRLPDVAVRWGLGGANTNAARANRLAQPDASPTQLARADSLAMRALGREPTSVPAVRALANVAALRNNLPRAERLFAYSERLSRRDLLTQMWLIEERVRHGDIPGALTHYDRALRTVSRARPVLFPVLVQAVGDPAVAKAVTPLLARRVAWGPDFLSVMAETPDASPDALGRLLLTARLRLAQPAEAVPLGAAIGRLVASGRYAAAYAAYRQATGARGADQLLRDGGFEADPVLPPFDWSFANETELSASREPGDKGTALMLRSSNDGAGEFARQLLLLGTGSYRLSLYTSGAGPDPLARAVVTVTCLGDGGQLMQLPLSARHKMQLSQTFTVPAGCAAQTLSIAAPAGLGSTDAVMIDDVAVVPLRR